MLWRDLPCSLGDGVALYVQLRFTTIRCSVGHLFSILTHPWGVRSKDLVEEESQWDETTSEVKLFAGTRWYLFWHSSLPPHKAGHLGSEFEKKLVLEKKSMQVTHLPPETIPLSERNIRDGDLYRKSPGAFFQRRCRMHRARVYWLWDVKCWFLGLEMVPQSYRPWCYQTCVTGAAVTWHREAQWDGVSSSPRAEDGKLAPALCLSCILFLMVCV